VFEDAVFEEAVFEEAGKLAFPKISGPPGRYARGAIDGRW